MERLGRNGATGEESTKSDQLIYKDTLNLFHLSQTAIIPVEAHGLVQDGRGQLYRIRCAETIPGTEFGCTVRHIHCDRNPFQPWIRAGKRKNALSQLIFLVTVRLDQQLQEGHG